MAAALGGDETGAIIGDIGLSISKFGFGGEDTPKAVTYSTLGCITERAAVPRSAKYEPKDLTAEDYALPADYPKSETNMEDPAPYISPQDRRAKRTWISGDVAMLGARHAESRAEAFSVREPYDAEGDPDWEVMEEIWSLAERQLGSRLSDHPVLTAERTWAKPEDRETLLELLFERFDVPCCYVGRAAALASFSAGRGTALVAECSHSGSSVTAIVDGYVLRKSIRRSVFGGADLEKRLLETLAKEGTLVTTRSAVRAKKQDSKHAGFKSFGELDVARSLKESASLVVRPTALKMHVPRSHSYELPDGTVIDLSAEMELLPECLFEHKAAETNVDVYLAATAPAATNGTTPAAPAPAPATATAWPFSWAAASLKPTRDTLPAMVRSSLERCDVDVRKDLLQNVVLTGGSSLFPGMAERLHSDVSQRLSSPFKTKVVSASPLERKFSVWIGGSILASLGSFQQTWLSKKEYDDEGGFLALERWD